MTKLSQELNECSQSTPELNGVIENNPIYMTTVPEIHSATLERVRKDQINSNGQIYPLGDLPDVNRDHAMYGHDGQGIMIDHDTHDQELELKQEILDPQEIRDEVLSPSSPCTPPRERLLIESQNQKPYSPSHFSQNCISVETLLPNLPDKSKLTEDFTSNESVSNVPELREMAVDVPDSFIGVLKSTPRYPPPKAFENSHSSSQAGKEQSAEFFISSSRDSSVASADVINVSDSKSSVSPLHSTSNCVERVDQHGQKFSADTNGILPHTSVDKEQMERIRKYQDDIKKRKEAENKQAKEEEFLRTSLRGSKKLQALEDNPPEPPRRGVVNTAFELEEGDSGAISANRLAKNHLIGEVEDPESKQTPELRKTFGASDLLQSLYRLKAALQNNGPKDADLFLVESLIRNEDFQNILAIHNKVQEVCCFKCPPNPVCSDAEDIIQEVMSLLQECTVPEASELMDILSKYEMEGLMYSHDKIAERQMLPSITPDEELLDRASQYTEESVKIVRIDKTNEPLGATVRNEGEAVVIGRIVKGGAAEKSGLLHEGDEILEVNGVEMRGKSVNDVCDILATMAGTLTFLIIPTQYEVKKGSCRDVVMHVKAHFDYDPEDDLYIPCRELGISFQKGDILHVINQDDPNWWQAYHEGEEDQALAGLIPSKSFQQQRESMKQTIVGEVNSKEKTKKGKFLCAKKQQKKKKKKVMYNGNLNDGVDGDQILTYEEVALYYPRANRKRPLVLIGPPNIGRHELRQRLMEDTERFAAAVPHTSRSKRDAEVDGVDYHFISRSQFEADILAGKFVEHGEYEKNYYGTSLDAIRTVVNSGKICVLNLHPQSLKILKNSDLKPYVVFVAPPSLEKLRQNRIKSGDNVKDDELKDIIEKAREMEENYGHYFDMVIINSDVDKTYNELLKEVNTLEREPQWVPAAWLLDSAQ